MPPSPSRSSYGVTGSQQLSLGAPAASGLAGCDAKSTTSGRKTADLKMVPQSVVEKALFQASFSLVKDTKVSASLTWILTTLEDLQLFTFAFSTALFPSIPSEIEAALDLFFFPHTDYATFRSFCITAIFLVMTTALLVGATMVTMQTKSRVPNLILRLLRLLCVSVTTAFAFPLTCVLVAGLNCFGGYLPVLNQVCTSAPHMPFLVFGPLSLVLLLPMLVIGPLMIVDTSPSSESPRAQANGRTDAQAAMIRTILAAGKVLTHSRPGLPTLVFSGVACAGLALNTFNLVRFQPYYHARMNLFRTGMSSGACASMVTALVLHLVLGNGASDLWLLLIPAGLVGTAVGYALSAFVARSYVKRTIGYWHKLRKEGVIPNTTTNTGAAMTAAAVDRDVIMESAARLASTTNIEPPISSSSMAAISTSVPGPRMLYTSSPSVAPDRHMRRRVDSDKSAGAAPFISSGKAALLSGPIYDSTTAIPTLVMTALSRENKQLHKGSSSALARRRSVRASEVALVPLKEKKQHHTSTDTLKAVLEEQKEPRTNVFDSPDQVELSIRYVRGYPSQRQLQVGFDILQRGLFEFPNDPRVLLVAVWYLTEFYGAEGERAADIVMRSLQEDKRSIPTDLRFFMYCHDRVGRDSGRQLLDSAAVGQLMRQLKSLHFKSLSCVRDLWELVRVGSTTEAMSDVISRLADAITGAEACYRRLLERNAKDKMILRLYAQWVTWCACDSAKAAQILDLAEEVETMESVAHAAAAASAAQQQGKQGTSSGPDVQSSHPTKASASLHDVMQSGVPEQDEDEAEEVAEEEDNSDAHSTKDMGSVDEVPSAIALSGQLDGRDAVLNDIRAMHRTRKLAPVHTKLERDPGNVAFRSSSSLAQVQGQVPPPPKEIIRPPPEVVLQEKTSGRRPEGGSPELDPIEAGHTGSQTSGTSASRQQRKRASRRRHVVERMEAPLNQVWLMAMPTLFFVASVICGFFICQRLFLDTSSFLNVQFDSARNARRATREIIESVRLMTYENMAGTEAGFSSALATTRRASRELVVDYLPVLTQNYRKLPYEPAKRRLFLNRSVNGTTDFTPIEVSSLEAIERIAQVAALATGFDQYGQLVPRVYQVLPELGLLVNHLPELVELATKIAYVYIEAYQAMLQLNSTYLILCGVLSLGSLLIAVGVIYRLVLLKYFDGEKVVHKLLLQVPKKSASAIVTNLEEELENFREWVEGDEDGGASPDGSSLDMDMRLPAGGASSGAAGGSGKGGKLTRTRKYTLALGVFVALLSGLLAIMYLLTITSLNQSADLKRMVNSADRRQYASLIRLYSREYVSPDTSLESKTVIRYLRGTIADLVSVHEKLSNDAGGLSDSLPYLTALPRVCSTAAQCLSAAVNSSIGYTLEGAQLPLNVAVNRLAETATEVTTAMANAKTYEVFITTPHYAKFELLVHLCTDVMSRLGLLDAAISQMLNDRVAVSSLVTVVVFVVFSAVLLAGLTLAVVVGLAKLRRESRALTTVPFLLSQSVLQQVPELNAFLESGGLALQLCQNGEPEAGSS